MSLNPGIILCNSSKACVESPKTTFCNVTHLDVLTPLFKVIEFTYSHNMECHTTNFRNLGFEETYKMT